jgi:hypothetical protein
MTDPIRKRPRLSAPRAVGALQALALSLAFASGAQAAPLPPDYVSAVADLRSLLTGPINHESGPQTTSIASETATGAGRSPNGSTASGTATASADESGALKVYVSDTVSTVPNEVFNLLVTAVADRVDTFHIAPPAGTTFSFLATLEWSGPSTAQCPVGTDCIVSVLNHLNRDGFLAMDNSLYYDSTDPNHQSLPGTQRIQQVWTFSSPNAFTLDEQLYLSSEVDANEGVGATFVSDLSHTGHFYLDPITPGATYTTASGLSYFTPTALAVPEPTSWALLCSGLLALGTLAWRRSSPRSPA